MILNRTKYDRIKEEADYTGKQMHVRKERLAI